MRLAGKEIPRGVPAILLPVLAMVTVALAQGQPAVDQLAPLLGAPSSCGWHQNFDWRYDHILSKTWPGLNASP